MLDSIIDCDRQIVFSRARERRQIAPSPGCSCLPWKCVCVYLVLERDIPFFLSLCSKKKREREKNKCEMLCARARACVRVEHTCYEVAARRGLRNNPSVISISKPHLCVWLNMKSQLPLLAFVDHLMPNLAKKKKALPFFFCVRACMRRHTAIFQIMKLFWQSGILHPKGFGLCQRTLHTHTGSCALIHTRASYSFGALLAAESFESESYPTLSGPSVCALTLEREGLKWETLAGELFSERCKTLN